LSLVVIQQMADAVWVPVYTKPRCEKVVADYCQRHGIPCYLPLMRRAKRYQRRTVETFLPMFSSYLFAQLGGDSRAQIVESHKIVRLVDVTPGQEQDLVRELNDLLRLEQLQTTTALVVLPELQPGQPVVVTEGPFKGMTAIVTRRRGLTRVAVNIELLGQAVTAEMDVGEIEIEKA
jgi:transcriptional antiterminator RfaH